MMWVWPSATLYTSLVTPPLSERVFFIMNPAVADRYIRMLQNQSVMKLAECFFSIIVIRIDYSKRFMEQVFCSKSGLSPIGLPLDGARTFTRIS